jgi:hypothetical protein
MSSCAWKELLVEKQLACIYTPDGTCRYTLTPERTAILQAHYNHTKTHKPRLMQKLKAGTFAEEVYKLMTRYKDGALVNLYHTHQNQD